MQSSKKRLFDQIGEGVLSKATEDEVLELQKDLTNFLKNNNKKQAPDTQILTKIKSVEEELGLIEPGNVDGSGKEVWMDSVWEVPIESIYETILQVEDTDLRWSLAVSFTAIVNQFMLMVVQVMFDNSDSGSEVKVIKKLSTNLTDFYARLERHSED